MAKKDNIQVSFGINGMERQGFSHLIDEKTYTFMQNGNIETDDESVALTNEQSNYLCSKLKPGYVVIGTKYDSINNKVWLFLTQKDLHTKEDNQGNIVEVRNSEIGYIEVNNEINDSSDTISECNCDVKTVLNTPLEEIENQIETCSYTTLIYDDCNNCLNFSPEYPITSIELKREACGYTMTFTSKNNPPRYIILDNIDYYTHEIDSQCGESAQIETCLDCDKLRLFPKYTTPTLNPSVINYGGSLKKGNYEFYIAYCDKIGNELTSYIASTNPITNFDFDNIQLETEKENENTNYSIKIKVSNLDRKFNFYKIAVIERTTKDIVTVYEEGVHSTSDSTVIYSSNSGKNRISINKLFSEKPVYKNFGGLVASNGILFGYDYNVEKEWNLQPMVNLLGSFVKWQTVEAGEDLYKDGINVANYKGYMRDEVYPMGIRFITNTGYKTSLFPLVGRPSSTEDLYDLLKDNNYNKDVESLLLNSATCASPDRKYRWQFYNTGKILGNSYSDIIYDSNKIITKKVEEDCIQENVKSKTDFKIEIEIEDDFYSLRDFVETHYDEIKNANRGDKYYYPDLKKLLTDDIIGECNIEEAIPFEICDVDCGVETCSTPVKTDSRLYIGDIINEVTQLVPKKYPWEVTTEVKYEHTSTKNKCYVNSKTQKLYADIEIIDTHNNPVDVKNTEISHFIDRQNTYENNSCVSALGLPAYSNSFSLDFTGTINLLKLNSNNQGGNIYTNINNYIQSPNRTQNTYVIDKNNLLTDVTAPNYSGFENKLSKTALWYELNFDNSDTLFIEITPETESSMVKDATSGDNEVRYTLYDDCKNLNILENGHGVYNSKEGKFLLINKNTYGKNRLYLTLDTKLIHLQNVTKKFKDAEGDPCIYTINGYVPSTTSACFDVKIREVEYYKATINASEIYMNKVSTYETFCKFNAPINENCGVIPHKYGIFSYWESKEKYPDNKDLYDSSIIKLNISNLDHEDQEIIDLFKDYYIDSTDAEGNAVWKNEDGISKANMVCKPIRHFKFPDNSVIPFMSSESLVDFSNSKIFPIGVTIDERTVNAFLDSAEKSGLIDKEQRDSIIGYEMYRGDRTTDKSIIFKGILNDMYEDKRNSKNNERTFFRNFPYNSLGKNQFITEDADRRVLLNHPYSSIKNNRFSLIAPEVYYNKPKSPSELQIDGYVYGKALTGFTKVKNHSEWVLLGAKAYSKADKLAMAEVLMEAALNIATLTVESSKNYWFQGGVVFGGNPIGSATSSIATAIYLGIEGINLVTYKLPKLKAQWLEIFEQRGSVNNFASMYVSSKGMYNYFIPNKDKGDMLRGLVTSKYLNNGLGVTFETDGTDSSVTIINNKDREGSMYLFTGEDFHINYPTKYINYDNTDVSPRNSSRYISSQNGCNDINLTKKIASPYATLKNYVPAQYGKIDEIKWLPLNHNILFNKESKNIFGGDIFISRVDLKNKVSLFDNNAVKLANRTAFKYSNSSNIGYTRFYVDHKSVDEEIGASDMPYLSSKYNMDCVIGSKKFYEGDPSKFYLYTYAIPYFLVESEINTNYRYSGKEYHEQFASRGVNVEDWVQEDNVSIAHNNIFYYNDVFSRNQTGLPYRILPSYYDKNKWDCLSDAENGVVWSEADNSEVSLSDPWLVFKPFNIYRFPFSYGKLISLDPLESTQVMGRFSNNMAIFNSIDVLKERINQDNEELGTGGIFAQRPVQFSNTELGETGSQHKSIVSCEFGHFWTDAKRGKVFQLEPNAKGLNTISDFKKSGGESGMRKWFKKHLPFKILKQGINNLTEEDTDNTFKGIGILMWWDSKFKRVFITKLDYKVVDKYIGKISYSNGIFNYINNEISTKIELTDSEYFKDVSWTIAYSPIYNNWISYYDFKPNYAIAYNDYFQTGINYSSDLKETGIWSHLINNKSYQVFYGKLYPWTIEVPIKNTYTNNVLNDLKIWGTSKRYSNDYDYSVWRKKLFNKLVVYNQTNISGLLHLEYEDSFKKSKYPIKISDTEQAIPVTHFDETISINYFYNRTKKEESHVPLWNWDDNEIYKSINNLAVSFSSKKVLERLRGDWFLVRLTQDKYSQFSSHFKWMVSKEEPY